MGDKIAAISPNNDDDFIEIDSIPLPDIINMVRGCPGSELALKLDTEDAENIVTITRENN